MITPIADSIVGAEKSMGLYEMHLQSPDSSGFHRYQIIFVERGGMLAEWRKDMGLASNFKGVRQLRIPSFMEHTVDELMDLADELRYPNDEEDVRELLGIHQVETGS